MEATRSRAGQEARRRLAVQKVGEGRSAADVADFLGVHVETVRRRVRAHRAGGDDALAGIPHPGRKPFLTPDQEAEVLGWLTRKPTEFGFRTGLWTDEAAEALGLLSQLPLDVDARARFPLAADLLALARRHNLSAYDAA